MIAYIKKHPFASFATCYFIFICFWWIKIYLFSVDVTTENYLFNLSYIVFNLLGGFGGIIIAQQKWGGFQSHIGRAITFLGIGLLAQGFGLVIWTYYNLILNIAVPYPSLADIGYFALIPAYGFAMINFAQTTGAKTSLKTIRGLAIAIIIPIVALVICYLFFLRNVGFDLSNPLKTVLDIAYPAGEAISVSLGLVTLALSWGVLGGRMKHKIELVIGALIFQFITEFTFLYTSATGTYYNASFVDLMYAASYFLMTLALLSYRHIEN